jgi:hypothetical protein
MTLVCTNEAELLDLNDSYCERRRGLRVRQARAVRVYEGGHGRTFGGETEDLSATGLRVVLPADARLRPGKMITVHVGNAASARQMIPAKVVWVDRGQSMEFLVAGVEFLASIAAHLDAA